MRLRLTVTAPEGRSDDLVVDCAEATPVDELIATLAGDLGVRAGAARTRRGAWAPGATAGEIDVRDGDVVELLPSAYGEDGAAPETGAVVDLVAVSGPVAGARIPLAEGSHTVGRGPGVDVELADRSMSRRHLVIEVGPDEVTVDDAGSTNGTYVAGAAVKLPRALLNGEQIEAGRTLLVVESHAGARPVPAAAGGRIAFNRPPRVARTGPAAVAPPPAAPLERESSSLPLGAALIPLALGGAMAAITGNLLLLSFALLTPAMVVYSHLESRRTSGHRHKTAVSDFRRDLDVTVAGLREARAAEEVVRRETAPDAAKLHRRAAELLPELWERRPGDEDALLLRVGTADLPSNIRVELPRGGDTELREQAIGELEERAILTAIPVTVPLGGNVLGVAGAPADVAGLARWLLAQAATLHSPAEVEIAAALADGGDWDWLKWLPHVRPGNLVEGAARARELLEDVAENGRRALVVVDGDLRVEPGLLSGAVAAGGGVIWLGRGVRELPGSCTWVVELDPSVARLKLTDVRGGTHLDDVTAEAIAPDAAEELARLLAPVTDAGAPELAGAIPAAVSLLDLLELPEPSAAAVADRWNAHRGQLRAPIGRAAGGPFEVDAGGTEGLRMVLAGMPGAGKSELLQTMIASLAATYPPDRLSFLLVDYKGGAAFRGCLELPHAVGLVTDLDEHLAERSRTSLLAELRRREGLLATHGAKSLRELTRKDPEAAPPALIIVVDEFATLVREVPSFVDTVLDVAQRGRSLGLHLVLATQRPRGAVSDGIRANTNLRIAMRMSDRAESEDVIDAPDAAAIPAAAPGRSIALGGRRPDGSPALVAFQAAYAGGRSASLGLAGVRVAPLRYGRDEEPAAPVVSRVGGGGPSDLDLLVEATRRAAADADLQPLAPPWLPPLPERLALDDLPPAEGAVIGLLDEPDAQRQRPFAIDLARDGSLLVYGASGSGKTVLLQTLACALAEQASPSEMQLYGLDFASGELRDIEVLPHCGSVVRGDEEERVLRLLGGLGRALADRKQRPADEVAGLPRVVLLIDGYGAFASALDRVGYGEPVQLVARLAAEGRSLGIHVVATADRRADVPGALSGVVQQRIVLRLAAADEYAALGVRGAAGAPPAAGRGFTGDGRELQVALAGDLEARGERLRSRSGGLRAPSIGTLAAHVPRDRMPAPPRPLQAVLGIDDESLQPFAVDFAEGHLLVSGPYRSGRTTTLATLAASLRAGAPDAALHLLAPRRSPLAELDVWTSVAVGLEAATEAAGRLAADDARPLVVFVDDATELAEGLAAPSLDALLARSRDEDIRLIAAAETNAAQRLFGGWLRDLRTEGRGLLLTPNVETDGDLLGVRLPRRGRGPFPPGRGFLVLRGASRLVQVAGDPR